MFKRVPSTIFENNLNHNLNYFIIHSIILHFRVLPLLSKNFSTNVSISQLGKEKETFQDVLPSIIDSLVSNPKFAQLPEVGGWIRQVYTNTLKFRHLLNLSLNLVAYHYLLKFDNSLAKICKDSDNANI